MLAKRKSAARGKEVTQSENAYFKILFEKVPEAIVIIDSKDKVLQVNGEFSRMFGYKKAEIIGKQIDQLVASPSLSGEAIKISRKVGAGKIFSLETQRKKKSGELFHVSVIAAPIHLGGKQVASFGIYRDISDRKRIEKAFQREKAFLEHLVETAAEGIIVHDLEGKVTRANGEFLRMFGFREKEVIGHSIDELIIPDSLRGEAKKYTQTTTGGSRLTAESVRQRKDGSLIQVSIIGSPIEIEGRQVAVYAIYREITAQKNAEKALRESEERYRSFFQNVPVGIFQTTPDGRYLDANAAHLQIFNYSDLASLKKINAADFYADPQERERWKEQMDRENIMRAQEFHSRRPDGKLIWTRESARTVRDEAGNVHHYEGIVEDITTLKETEQAFNREKAFLEQLVETAAEGIIVHDLEGMVTRANSEFLRMFGFQENEVFGRSIDELIIPGHLRNEAQNLTKTATGGGHFAVETIRRRKDGAMINVSIIGSPIAIDGKQVGVYAIYRDITDRKKAEEAYFRENAYLEQLITTAAEGIVVLDLKGRISKVNHEFLRMFGYEQDEALGHDIDDLIIPPQRIEEGLNLTGTAMGGNRFAVETVRRRKDGTPIHVSIIGSPIVIHGEQIAVYGIYRDITDRKLTEEAFQKEKAYLEQLIESAPEAIVLADNAGKIIRINSEFQRLFGYSESESVDRYIDELVAPKDFQKEALGVTKTVSQGKKFGLESVRRSKDGTLIHVSIIGSPIVIHGEQVAVFGIYRDISDRKKAEAELLENRKLLLAANQSLRERSRQLEEANALLERISNLDGLTAIPNRRYFEHFYDIEWRRARREKKSISVIMIDVDFFKNFNDNHGHLSGDECLKRIANTLHVVNRAGDMIARYGGEEFVVVLPNTDQSGALFLAERMRQRVKDLNIMHGSSQVSTFVTISLGIATQVPDMNGTPLDLLTKADLALYQAKTKGRDRIEY